MSRIPKTIYQTFESSTFSEPFQTIINSWKEKNPGYTYCFYDKDQRSAFLKENFDERVIRAYNRIIPGAYKADLWRYCILYLYGGIYVDVDTLCLGSLDDFITEDTELMVPIDLNTSPSEGKHNLSNGFIATAPKSPVLFDCIERVLSNVENNREPPSKLDFAGPGVLGRSVNTYLGLPETESFLGKEGHVKNIHFLHFNRENEYVGDRTNILFQNKNGNPLISRLYGDEMKKHNVVFWVTADKVLE